MADDIRLKVNVDGAAAARSELRSVGTSVNNTARTAQTGGKSIGGFLKAGVVGGVLAAVAAVGVLGHVIGDSIGEAREAAQVGAQTNAVLKSTGGAANIGARGVGNLATALSRKAGVDDELIQSGENVLLTFTKVRNETGRGNQIFTRATKTALDMSTALGTDLKGSNIQLGKALNDPIKGISALTRVGVTFSEQQKDQIKTMVKSGDTLGAQKLILAELSKEFGGSAAAQANAGDKFQVAIGNLKESIGTALLPSLDKAATALTPLIESLSSKVGPAIEKVGGFLKDLAGGWLQGAGGADGLRSALDDAQPAITLVQGAIKGLAFAAVKYAPVLGSQFRTSVKVIGALASAFIYTYNNGVVPFVRLSLRGIGAFTRGLGTAIYAVGVLSRNKGLQQTGRDLVDAGKKAQQLATRIQKIPDRKPKIQPVIGSTNAIENRINTLTRDRHVRVILDNPSVNKPRVSTTGGGGQTGGGRYSTAVLEAPATVVTHNHNVNIRVEAAVGNRAQIGAELADYLEDYYALGG